MSPGLMVMLFVAALIVAARVFLTDDRTPPVPPIHHPNFDYPSHPAGKQARPGTPDDGEGARLAMLTDHFHR